MKHIFLKYSLLIICFLLSGNILNAQENNKKENKTRQDTLSEKQKKEREFRFIQFAEKGKSDSVLILLEKGTDVNARTWDNYSALIFASQNGHLNTVQILLQNGAKTDLKSESNESALISAAKFSHDTIAEELIIRGADLDIVDGTKTSALIYASAFDDFNMVDMLLHYGAEIDKTGKNHETALFVATAQSFYSIVKLLLEKGADTSIPDNSKNTPLFIASNNADLEITGLLIENGAEVNSVNSKGYTPLDVAIINNDSLMVGILLDRGADPYHKVNKHINTLTLAEQYTRGKGIINLLRSYNVKKIRIPYIDFFPVSFNNTVNFNDYMFGGSLGMHEGRYNFMLSLGYLTNPSEKSILLERENSEYYQVRERRHMIFANFEKNFPFYRSYREIESGLIAGLSGYYYMGKYQGLKEKPAKDFILSPNIGFYHQWRKKNIFLKYEYLNMNKEKISPHRLSVGISLLLHAD